MELNADDYLTGDCLREVGEDGRISLPGVWKSLSGRTARLWHAFGESKARIYHPSFWLLYAEALKGLEASDEARRFFSNTTPLAVDAQGRCVLPRKLREDLSITSTVRLTGLGTYLEVEPAQRE